MILKKQWLYIYLAFLLPTLAFGNNVKGVVVNESTRKPLEFANVTVIRSADSFLVSGTVTDKQGEFEIQNLPDGKYFLRIGYIGYEDKKTEEFVLDTQHTEKNMGIIKIVETDVEVNDVVVTSKKLLMNNTIDRKVYNVDQDILSKSGSASELLQNIPSIEVDIEGNVSLRGSSNVLILINGKTSPLMGKSQAAVLQQIPAVSIEKIEVITNPSAKYKPDGTSGIINIVLKKNTGLGLNGNVTVNAGNDNRYNGNVRLNYNPGKANVYGSCGYRKDSRNRINAGTETGIPPYVYYYNQTLNSYARPISHMFALGIDYKFDKSNSAGISGDYFHNGFT